MKKYIFLIIIGLSLGCSNKLSNPNEDFIKSKLGEIITNYSDNKVDLIQFKKINGINVDRNGMKFYGCEFDGQIKYKQNGFIPIETTEIGKKGFLLIENEKPSYLLTGKAWEKVEKNQKVDIKGKILFLKKENGWSVYYILIGRNF